MLTSAGDTSNEHIISALLSNIWKAFAGSKKGLEFMLLDCQVRVGRAMPTGSLRRSSHGTRAHRTARLL